MLEFQLRAVDFELNLHRGLAKLVTPTMISKFGVSNYQEASFALRNDSNSKHPSLSTQHLRPREQFTAAPSSRIAIDVMTNDIINR
ncbi:MAG: hypothetical protein MHMPM18_002344 [Marteilia pararefringens]